MPILGKPLARYSANDVNDIIIIIIIIIIRSNGWYDDERLSSYDGNIVGGYD